MAPRRPSPAKVAASSKSDTAQSSATALGRADSLFPSSKQDKRRIKHAQLMSKVTKSASPKARRRRPHKKLATKLDALADALPSDNEQDENATREAGVKPAQQVNIIKRKSMKSRPGAMKRREKVDKNERDRFARNLAQMAGPGDSNQAVNKTNSTDKWKALRGFISETLETRSDLAKAHQA